ncbi:MAG: hypothetical protein ACREF4_13830, partial [Gammaproteobacteria bacterium]
MAIASPTAQRASRRLIVGLMTASLLAGALPLGAVATTGDPVLINDAYVSHTGTDTTEYLELYGTPGTALTGLSIISVEGNSTSTPGTIDRRIDLTGTLGANGFHLLGNPAGFAINFPTVTPNTSIGNDTFENDSLTLALVTTASVGAQGTLVTGSEVVRDAVALYDGAGADTFSFGAPQLGPDGSGFFPSGVHRVTDGVDTDGTADWAFNNFGVISANDPDAGTPLVANQPVVANCGATLSAFQGLAATRIVTASDDDGTVVSLAITGITPSDPGTIMIGPTTPAGAVGGTASATVTVSATTPIGSYAVAILATNNDGTPQTDDCTLNVTVSGATPIGTVQGSVSDAQDGLLHRSPFAPASGNGGGAVDVFVRGVVTQKFLLRTSAGANSYG